MDEDIQIKIDQNEAEIARLQSELSPTEEQENIKLGKKIADAAFSNKQEVAIRDRLKKIGIIKGS